MCVPSQMTLQAVLLCLCLCLCIGIRIGIGLPYPISLSLYIYIYIYTSPRARSQLDPKLDNPHHLLIPPLLAALVLDLGPPPAPSPTNNCLHVSMCASTLGRVHANLLCSVPVLMATQLPCGHVTGRWATVVTHACIWFIYICMHVC